MINKQPQSLKSAPLSDAIITAVSRLVGDAQGDPRDPTHSEIDFQVKRVKLEAADPKMQGQTVGKTKRVRAVLSWALENRFESGTAFVTNLISSIKGCGGFRQTSTNYVGSEAIKNAAATFRAEGYELTDDGELRSLLLENLTGVELTAALEAYVRRAKRGVEDSALVAGTSKDLLEATAGHVLEELWGGYSTSDNFPTLLGQAFIALKWATPQDPIIQGEKAQRKFERAMYQIACAVNTLRNKEGTGHGRPWISSVTDDEAKAAVEFMGVLSESMLTALKRMKKPSP